MAHFHPIVPPVAPFPSQAYTNGNTYYMADGSTCQKPVTAAIGDALVGPKYQGGKNDGWIGIFVVIDITAFGTGTATLKLQGYDPLSTKWYDVPGAVTAALAANATTTLLVLPGTIETANVRVSHLCPPQWRLVLTIGGSSAVTMSVNAWLLEQ